VNHKNGLLIKALDNIINFKAYHYIAVMIGFFPKNPTVDIHSSHITNPIHLEMQIFIN